MMPIDRIPDWEQRLARQDAFWLCEIIDRPVVEITFRDLNPDFPSPLPKQDQSLRERWMDSQYVAECALAQVMNTAYLGDALPIAWPNLGPDVFMAFFGGELEFGETTSWSTPILEDWAEVDRIRFSNENFYWRKIIEMTDALLEIGKGAFYTGFTDLHTGGDAIAAFRDPQELNIDMLEATEAVKSLLSGLEREYFRIFDFFYEKLHAAGQACTGWPSIVSTKKWDVPSNDFSCMISKAMFDEVFLPGIAEQCRHVDASIYHLDGPNALQHLESLLEIKELSAIQWIYGAGNGRASDWLPVYQRCQQAGKGVQIWLEPDEIDFFIANLRPEGVWIGLKEVNNYEQAEYLLKKFDSWK